MAVDLKLFKRLTNPDYYRSLAPGLTVDGAAMQDCGSGYDMDEELPGQLLNSLDADGYFSSPVIIPQADCDTVVRAIETVMDAGLPPVFATVYTETWRLFAGLHPLIEQMLGPDYRYNPSMWAWYVGDGKGEEGWNAHRDQPMEAKILGEDGKPNQVVFWIALSEITWDSSCIYVLPTSEDPAFPNDLWISDVPRLALSAVRPLPASPGMVLGWHGGLLHWSGMRLNRTRPPRISMILIAHRVDDSLCDVPQYTPARPVSFQDRLGIIARSMDKYGGAYQDSPELSFFCQAFGGLYDVSERRLKKRRSRH